MTKSEYIDLLSRRLGVSMARIEGVLERLHAADLVHPTTGSRRFPPDISEPEAVVLLLAVAASPKLQDAATVASGLMNATAPDGQRFGDVLAALLSGPPRHVEHCILRASPASASIVVGGRHEVFGRHSDGSARLVPGAAIITIAAELQGASPRDADVMATIINIRRASCPT